MFPKSCKINRMSKNKLNLNRFIQRTILAFSVELSLQRNSKGLWTLCIKIACDANEHAFPASILSPYVIFDSFPFLIGNQLMDASTALFISIHQSTGYFIFGWICSDFHTSLNSLIAIFHILLTNASFSFLFFCLCKTDSPRLNDAGRSDTCKARNHVAASASSQSATVSQCHAFSDGKVRDLNCFSQGFS